MQPYVVIEKRVGETPLAAMEAWRQAVGLDPAIPLTYAGRLDPMASGKLLVLIGDECKRQGAYHRLDKEYACTILLGVETDSGDVLGLANAASETPLAPPLRAVRRALAALRGRQTFPYPRFSSKTVHGKPLFLWTLEGRLDEIEIPRYTAAVHALNLIGVDTVPADALHAAITKKIGRLSTVTAPSKRLGADWRRQEILARWDSLLGGRTEPFPVLRIRATVGAGTYIRSLAPAIAARLGTSGTVLDLERTRIGRFMPIAGRGVWTRIY